MNKQAAWFAETGLLNNKVIRNYLSSYSPGQWPEVIKLSLIYGILNLQKQYPQQVLAVDSLKDAVSRSSQAAVLEERLPALRQTLLTLQGQLEDVTAEVSNQVRSPKRSGGAAHQASGPAQKQQGKSSPQMDEGQAMQYPLWWGDGSDRPLPKGA